MNTLKRILIAEDDPKDVELALKGLALYNLANEVVAVRDGVEALDYLKRRGSFAGRPAGNPALALIDLKMPRLDGLQLLREIRADAELDTIPVVMMTSSQEAQDLEDSYKLGINAYVVKPVKFTEFIEAVKQIGLFWALINVPPAGSVGREGK